MAESPLCLLADRAGSQRGTERLLRREDRRTTTELMKQSSVPLRTSGTLTPGGRRLGSGLCWEGRGRVRTVLLGPGSAWSLGLVLGGRGAAGLHGPGGGRVERAGRRLGVGSAGTS